MPAPRSFRRRTARRIVRRAALAPRLLAAAALLLLPWSEADACASSVAGAPVIDPRALQEDDAAAAVPDAPSITWPDLPGTAFVAALELRAPAPELVDPWPVERARDDAGWTAAWRDFAADLVAEAAARADDAPAATADDRARLARLALRAFHQGRDADGWAHLADLAAVDPDRASALLPHLVVGAPLAETSRAPVDGAAPAWDGRLPAGVVLRPVLPPPDPLDPKRRPVREGHEVVGLVIGESRVTMRLHVRGDGVDLRFRLDAGPPVAFSAVIPNPPGVRVAIEYFDWERAETLGEPLPVNLTETDQWYRLWGRLRLARTAWPTVSPAHVPAVLERSGLELVIADADPEAAFVDGFAAACEALFPFEVHRVDPATAGPAPTAHRIDLTEPGEQRDAKLRDLAAHLEGFVLAPPR